MGAVWRAFDRELKREVALKTLPPPEEAEGGEAGRLLGEAEAVAKLDHDGIVRIYDIGTDAGRPFLSLELCPGGTLKERLGLAAGPLPPRVAASVIERVARAVQHAHERGIIHRDLKPANVLLVEGPEMPLDQCRFKVADFGLAKRVEIAGPTPSGALLGTPAYMSPEQVRGGQGVGPATDVHALGVMLYEMLTGRLPYQGANLHETLMRTVQDDPVPPRQARPRLSRDLETICLKCLEKDPARRYAGAGDLADDLRHFIDGEAIRARPPTVWRRSRRWLRRRALTVAVAALLLVITAGSLGGWWWSRLSREREWAAFQIVRASLRQSLASFDVTRLMPERSSVSELVALLNDLAEKVPLYEAMIRKYPADAELRAELVKTYRLMAWLEALYGDRDRAVVLAEKARAVVAELAKAHPDTPAYRSEWADVHSDLGTLHGLLQQLEEAQEAYEEAIRQRERLVAENTADADQARQLALAWLALGELHQGRRNLAEAEAAFTKAQEGRRLFRVAGPRDPRPPLPDATYFVRRGQALARVGRDEEADEAFHDALARMDEVFGPGSARAAVTVDAAPPLAAARALPAEGPAAVRTFDDLLHLVTPEDICRKAVEFHSRMAKKHPDEPAYKQRLARSYYYLAGFTFLVKWAAGAEEAVASARQGTALYDGLLKAAPTNGDYSLQEAQLCSLTATSLFLVAGRDDEAAAWCAQALAVLDAATIGEGQRDAARVIRRDTFLARGNVLARQGRFLEALADFSRAFAIDPAARKGPTGEYYAVILAAVRQRLIGTLLRKERYQEALAEAATLARIPGLPGQGLYDAACVFAVVAGKTPDANSREKHAARCVELLRLAHAAGFAKGTIPGGDPVRHMERDEDLVAVRERADYKKLLADLAGKP
jgi:serine/threonine protein kinase/tetratricopeptide (TPR) repeat protein